MTSVNQLDLTLDCSGMGRVRRMVRRTFRGRVYIVHRHRYKMVDYTYKNLDYTYQLQRTTIEGQRSIWKKLRGRRGESGIVWRSVIRGSRALDLTLVVAYSRDLVSMSTLMRNSGIERE